MKQYMRMPETCVIVSKTVKRKTKDTSVARFALPSPKRER